MVGYDIVNALDAASNLPPEQQVFLDRWKMMLADNLEQFRKFRAAGVKFIAGTDAGWRLTRFDDLANELYL